MVTEHASVPPLFGPTFHALVSSPAESGVPVWLEQETASALWFIIDVREDQQCTLAREKMRVLEGTASSCWRSWVSAQAFLSGSRGTKPSTDRWHILKAFCTLSSNVRPTAITCIHNKKCIGRVACLKEIKFNKRMWSRSIYLFLFLVNLSNTLHGTADFMGHALKAVQVPAGDFGDNVVQTGLETGRCFLWHSVLDLGQRDAQSQFGGYKCQRITETHNHIKTWKKRKNGSVFK